MALRRLAYERSWFFVVLGLFGLGGIAYYSVETGVGIASGDFLVPLVAVPVLVLLIRRGITGSRTKRQLWIDVAAGKLVLPDGTEHALDSLGALSIDKRYQARMSAARDPLYWHELKAASLEHPLFSDLFEGQTKRRLAALDAAVRQSALRRLLERPQVDGAFRAGPDLATEAVTHAGSPEHALAGLRALGEQDHDGAIREQATKLAALIESSKTAS